MRNPWFSIQEKLQIAKIVIPLWMPRHGALSREGSFIVTANEDYSVKGCACKLIIGKLGGSGRTTMKQKNGEKKIIRTNFQIKKIA